VFDNQNAVAMDWVLGVDVDVVMVGGLEFSGGYVLDTDRVTDSGFYGNKSAAVGLNGGAGGYAGFALRDIEGYGESIDVNTPFGFGFSIYIDSRGFNGGALSLGPGVGVSYAGGGTNTLTWNDIFSMWFSK
jgi:hypothetical protein